MAKVDAHVIQPEEYEEIPELGEAFFDRAAYEVGGAPAPKPARRGRPPSAAPKVAVKLRLDPDVVEAFKAGGPGWQTRVNDVLRQAVSAQLAERKA